MDGTDSPLELGLDNFGDVTVDAEGLPGSAAQVLRGVVDESALDDQVGVNFVGTGQHRRRDGGGVGSTRPW